MKIQIKYIFWFIFFITQGFSAEVPTIEFSEKKLVGNYYQLYFRSIKEGDDKIIETLVSSCDYKERLPTNPIPWAQNLISRQEDGNPYSGLMLEIESQPVGFLCLGMMPAAGDYPGYKIKEHAEILQTYLDFGAIREKQNPIENPTYSREKYEAVDDCGIGFLLPILPSTLDGEIITNALKIGISAFQKLKENSIRLHKEHTIPGCVIGLFHPDDDPLMPHLRAAGFDILEKEGFKEYYKKPYSMAYNSLAQCEDSCDLGPLTKIKFGS